MSSEEPAAGVKRRALLRESLLVELHAHTPAAAMRAIRRRPGGTLSLIHLHVLSVLDLDGPQAMNALAEALDVSQASATGIVDRMEARGLVIRQRDAADRRIVRVLPTDDGRGVLADFASARRDELADLLDELTEPELNGLLRGARALRRARERHQERHLARQASATAPGPSAAR
jgi:DNA-binding MarR family transcriptional regulator